MPVGYVYVLSNPTLPGLLKIGFTTHPVEERAAELSAATGVARAFQVEYWHLTLSADEVERLVHEKFKAVRLNKKREFFRVEIDEAIGEIERHLKAPIASFRRTPATADRHNLYACPRCGHRWERDFVNMFCPKCW